MSQLIEYVRKQGPIVGYEYNPEITIDGEPTLTPIYTRGVPYGCFFAKKVMDENGKYRIAVGWSLCNKKDNFSKDEAVLIASERALNVWEPLQNNKMIIPHSLRNKFIKFCDRAKRFYQIDEFAHTYVVMKEERLDV